MIRLPQWLLVVLTLALLVGLATPALADEARGKIKKLSADRNEFTLTDQNNKEWTFSLDDAAKVRLGDKDGRLNDLKEGDEVTVTYQKKGEKLMATEIRAQQK